MQFFTLDDETRLLESTLFPLVYRALSGRLRGLGPYVVEGKVERDHRSVNLTVSGIEPYEAPGVAPETARA